MRLARQDSRGLRSAARSRAGRGSRPGPATTSRPSAFSARAAGQHRVGLADAGRGAEKNLQMPAPFLLGEGEQGVGRSSLRFLAGMRLLCAPSLRLQPVEREVELEHVDARLAEQAERAALDLALRPGRARALPAGRAPWRPAAPETAPPPARCAGRAAAEVVTRSTGTGADGFSCLQLVDIALEPVGQRLAGRPEVGAAGVRRVVGRVTVLLESFGSGAAGRGRAAVEILVAR